MAHHPAHSPGFLALVADAKTRHLPGARHLSKGIIERDIEKAVAEKNAPIVCYCGGGFRSVLVSDNLQKMGYTNVISLDGGFRGWSEKGLPIQTD